MHEERYLFAYAPNNILQVRSGYSGGDPFRTSLQYLDNLSGGITAPLHLEFSRDTIGRLSQVRWNTAPGSGGSMTTLADYTWVGGLRRSRTTTYSSGNTGATSFDYDAYGRLTQIQDDQTLGSSGPTTISQFDYEYDAAGNLKRERYTTVGSRVGDRFLSDAYHRLSHAFLGVDSNTMDSLSDAQLLAMSYSSSSVQTRITYGLDVANNRTDVTENTSTDPNGVTEYYDLQDGSHTQGPSNRYDTVGGVVYSYDSRGNLTYDGRFYYAYDYLNRLQEVWQVVPSFASVTGNGEERYGVLDEGALEASVQNVKSAVPGVLHRAAREHRDPTFRGRLRASIRGGVLRLNSGSRGGGWPGRILEDAELELVAVYGYDAFNRRIIRVVLGVDTNFHTYDGWKEVVEYTLNTSNGTANPIKEFVRGARMDEIVSYRRRVGSGGSYSWESYFLHHGGQDTAAKLVDSSGQIVEQYEYDPYGRARVFDRFGVEIGNGASVVGLPFLWKAVRLDVETGLLYMRNRYYSVGMGRFLTQDPLGTWADPQSCGCGYAYTGNSPLVWGDPLGLQTDARGWPATPCYQCHDLGNRFGPARFFADRQVFASIVTVICDIAVVTVQTVAEEAAGAIGAVVFVGAELVQGKVGAALLEAIAAVPGIPRARALERLGDCIERLPKNVQEAIGRQAGGVADAARGGRGAVNVTSGGRTVDEALTTGQRFVGEGAQEVGPGVFRSADGTRQFRMTDADITGSHGKIGPHVHFEKFDPLTGEKIKNIHTPLRDQ